MTTQAKNIPKLRFPEFQNDGEWEEKKLEKLTVKMYSGGTPSVSNPDYYGGNIPFIRSAEINADKTELFLTSEGLNNSSAKMVDKGDILYALYGATSGEVGISKIKGAINQAILAIITKIEYSSEFIYQWLLRNKKNITKTYLQGGQGNLSATIIKDLKIKISTLPEQQKIADCLSSLDDRIQAETNKLEQLKAHKKGLMQKLFPKEGQTRPEYRFPEFQNEGEWEEKTLGDIIIEVKRPIKLIDNEEYQLVTVKRRNEGIVPRVRLLGKDILVKSYSRVLQGDYLISKRQIIHGANGVVPHSLDNSIVSNEYTVIESSQFITTEFLGILSKTEIMKKIFVFCCYGIDIEKMVFNINDWKKKKIHIPTLPEQQKIANCLSSLDTLITAQTDKIELLETHKKGLMQQLFC